MQQWSACVLLCVSIAWTSAQLQQSGEDEVTSVSHNDAVHVGCFKTNLVDTQRSYYMVNEPLSWENGISACIHRYTTHVGVQADNSTPSKSYFFCGNDLLEHSDKLEDSACAPCEDPADRHCGGPQSLSVYKIRDSTPLVIFAATKRGVRVLEVDGSHTKYSGPFQNPTESLRNDPIHIPTSSERIDLLYSQDEVVFQNWTGDKLYKSFLDHQRKQYRTPIRLQANSAYVGFTVDWVHRQIYYCEDNRGHGENKVMEYDMSSGKTKQLYTSNSNCYDLAIDPYTRTLFAVFENGTLSSFSLLSEVQRVYRGGENHQLKSARRLAVDFDSQLVYVTARLSADDVECLARLDYADTSLTVLFRGPENNNSYGLDVFGDSVVWDNWCGYQNTIYVCKLSATSCERRNLRLLHGSTSDGVNDIVVYHPLKQTPTERFLCKPLACSHICTRVTIFTAKCTCPEELTLGTDNATCQGSRKVSEITAAPSVSFRTAANHDMKTRLNETEETKQLSLLELQRLVLLKQLDYYMKAERLASVQLEHELTKQHCTRNASPVDNVDPDGMTVTDDRQESSICMSLFPGDCEDL